jgi:predicted ArsR family transcriptional regulator
MGRLSVDTPMVPGLCSADLPRSVSDTMSSAERASRRRQVLRVLRASRGPMTILAIAEELDVHPNTVRFHLDSLVGNELVEQVEPGRHGPGRPPLMFQAVRQMDRGGPRRYELLAEILTTRVAAERNSRAKAIAAGHAWGLSPTLALQSPPRGRLSAEETIDHLVEILDELGFAPERRTGEGGQQIGLRHCPFLELAESQTSVVCRIHLGIMQGALESWGASIVVDRLDPFVEPDLCVAHLARQPAGR